MSEPGLALKGLRRFAGLAWPYSLGLSLSIFTWSVFLHFLIEGSFHNPEGLRMLLSCLASKIFLSVYYFRKRFPPAPTAEEKLRNYKKAKAPEFNIMQLVLLGATLL